MPNIIGKTLGKVHVDMFLAKGGMAEVYIGNHTTLHRSVAIKFLKADLQDEPDLRERFEREARVIAMLRHPNIIQIYDFDSYVNQPYLIMEYVPGTSLGAYLRDLHKKDQRLDINLVNNLLGKIANALTYAHDNNVIHRDIKPANILLTSRSTPVSVDTALPDDVEPILTDFGLVRFTQATTQTSTGYITGTPVYMSPEQSRGDTVNARSDVYSLGITVYEMLAGRVPFDADTAMGVLHQHINEPHPPIEGISERLQKVIDRALEKDADDRFRTPLEFAEAFNSALTTSTESETMLFPAAISRSITVTRQNLQAIVVDNKKNKYATPIIIGVTAVIVAIGALITLRMPSSPVLPADLLPAPTTESIPAESVPETVGLFRFQDGSAEADQVTFSSKNLPPPPEGSQYEAWLLEDDNEHRISIGTIQFSSDGAASLTYVDDSGQNLITLYHKAEITIEPNPDNNPNPSNEIAFSATLPSSGYSHVRHLLSGFNSTPNQTAFIHGLKKSTDLLNTLSQDMLSALEEGDGANMRLKAEQMLNMVAGSQDPGYKDWNGNGNIDDPSDGYGLLLNGNNSGYIQGTIAHANLMLTSSDATENMLIHGEHIMAAADNLNLWTPQLRDQLIAVLDATSLTDAEGPVRQAVVLANQIHNGVDVNGNENIEAIPGEGGATTAYDHAYYMADISIKP
ncbi:MAG TPA: protein kinase [Anaerolineales bacterium]|nr:protein kinase [Anaerolineales bacterium]